MSRFIFYCSFCGQKFEADDSYAGKKIICPSCQNEFLVPQKNIQTNTIIKLPTQNKPIFLQKLLNMILHSANILRKRFFPKKENIENAKQKIYKLIADNYPNIKNNLYLKFKIIYSGEKKKRNIKLTLALLFLVLILVTVIVFLLKNEKTEDSRALANQVESENFYLSSPKNNTPIASPKNNTSKKDIAQQNISSNDNNFINSQKLSKKFLGAHLYLCSIYKAIGKAPNTEKTADGVCSMALIILAMQKEKIMPQDYENALNEHLAAFIKLCEMDPKMKNNQYDYSDQSIDPFTMLAEIKIIVDKLKQTKLNFDNVCDKYGLNHF